MYTVPSVYFSCFLPTKAWSWTTLFCDWQPCPHTVWQDALCVQSAGNGILARSFIWICRTSSFARISAWTCGIKQSRTNNFNYLMASSNPAPTISTIWTIWIIVSNLNVLSQVEIFPSSSGLFVRSTILNVFELTHTWHIRFVMLHVKCSPRRCRMV